MDINAFYFLKLDPHSKLSDLEIKKTLDSGDRRSFICRVKGKNDTSCYFPNYTSVQFVGYINSELSSNLTYNYLPDSTNQTTETLGILNNHSTTSIKNKVYDYETSTKNDPMIYYFIAHGSAFKQPASFTPSCFICKYDVDANFVYAENW